jgi:hypothetical protein
LKSISKFEDICIENMSIFLLIEPAVCPRWKVLATEVAVCPELPPRPIPPVPRTMLVQVKWICNTNTNYQHCRGGGGTEFENSKVYEFFSRIVDMFDAQRFHSILDICCKVILQEMFLGLASPWETWLRIFLRFVRTGQILAKNVHVLIQLCKMKYAVQPVLLLTYWRLIFLLSAILWAVQITEP